nr:smalltalk protein [uncultured Bacteroides sp.]
MKISKNIWDIIVKVIIAIVGVLAGGVGADAMNL